MIITPTRALRPKPISCYQITITLKFTTKRKNYWTKPKIKAGEEKQCHEHSSGKLVAESHARFGPLEALNENTT